MSLVERCPHFRGVLIREVSLEKGALSSNLPTYLSLSLSISQCLSEVLVVPSDVKLILLPGDNDIGGEGGEGMRDTINQ